MLIDWFTVVAQAINFLILVWLMKRFLYQPILRALDAREMRIAAELADADSKQAEALKERDEFRRKNDEFDQQHTTMLKQATEEAAAEHGRLFDKVRKDADNLRDKLHDKLDTEYRNLHDEFARRTRTEVFAIARKALADLSGDSLEARMAEVFVQRLNGLNKDEKARLAAMCKSLSHAAQIRSAFELSPAQRTSIEDAVKSVTENKGSVQFEVVPDLVGGIELIMDGQKVAWSISDYLASLEKDVNELLKAQHKTNHSKPQ